jgi:transcriptional regulator with XRE-family HTH domain
MPTLKEVRESKFFSQHDLAESTGLSVSTINRIENGKQKPLPRTIRKIAKALQVDPSVIEW